MFFIYKNRSFPTTNFEIIILKPFVALILSSGYNFTVYLHNTIYLHLLKEVYSNFCMKIHISSKLKQYLININKMGFPMINCLKCAQQYQKGIFKEMCRATTVPYSVMWVSPRYYVNICKYGESPYT